MFRRSQILVSSIYDVCGRSSLPNTRKYFNGYINTTGSRRANLAKFMFLTCYVPTHWNDEDGGGDGGASGARRMALLQRENHLYISISLYLYLHLFFIRLPLGECANCYTLNHIEWLSSSKIGTWSVRSINLGKLEIVKREINIIAIETLGVSELRWTSTRCFIQDMRNTRKREPP